MSLNTKPEETLTVDKLSVHVYSDRRQLGTAAGREAAEAIRRKLTEKEQVRIIFAAAPSQNEFLEQLRQEEGIDWKRITAFHMDEYIGLPERAPQRFAEFLKRGIFEYTHPGIIHFIDGKEGFEAECSWYTALLREAPIDFVFLGIGENGHIAFNDPPVANFADPEMVKAVLLEEACRQQQVNDGCFPDLDTVPLYALTLTIPALMSADQLFCMVPGPTKRQAVTDTLRMPISTACPATILRTHPNCTLYVDKESFGDFKKD